MDKAQMCLNKGCALPWYDFHEQTAKPCTETCLMIPSEQSPAAGFAIPLPTKESLDG